MPKSAADLENDPFLSLLVISPSGGGKTALIATAPKPVYVICSDDESKLQSASQRDKSFVYDMVDSTIGPTLLSQFEKAILQARSGKYATVVWDTISTFADYLVNAELEATDKGNGPDGRQAYGNFARRLVNCVSRFITIPAHRICMAHYYEPSKEIDGQLKKEGQGILPGIPGQARQKIPGMFRDVVYLKKVTGADTEERELITRVSGVYGPRMITMPGVTSIPADLEGLVELLKKAKTGPIGKPTVKPAAVKLAAKPLPRPAPQGVRR